MNARTLIFLLCLVTFSVSALSTGASVLYLLLLVLLTMAVIGALSVAVALVSVRVSMQTPKRKLSRGDKASMSVSVRYVSVFPVHSFRLQLLVPEDTSVRKSVEIALMPFSERQFGYDLTCPHRGIYHVGVESVCATDIFQLFSVSRKLRERQVLIEVRPNTTRLPALELRSGESEPAMISRAAEDTASPSDVRTYQAGDPLKRIHWKLSVRKRELLVRTYEESSRPDTLILPDLSSTNLMRSQALTIEDMVTETAASIALAQLSAGYPVRMPLMCAHPQEPVGQNETAFPRFLDALMRVNFDSPYPYEQVLALEMRRMQRTGGAVLITSRLTPRIADVARQMRRFGMQVSVCWITETRRADALEMVQRMKLAGIQAHRIDPWGRGLNEESLLQSRVNYGQTR